MIAQAPDRQVRRHPEGVEEAVKRRLGSRVRDFRVLVLAEGLVLLGEARTYYAKQLAQHAVMQEMAVRVLINQIEVVGD